MRIIEYINFYLGVLLLATTVILQAASETTIQQEERQLAIGDFADFNRILDGAVLRIPDTALRSDGVTLRLSNVRCLDLSIGDVNLWSRQTSFQTVEMNLRVIDLGMICRARYSFSWGFISGSGEAEILSVGNDATIQGLVKSANYLSIPPEDVIINTCNPTIWINRVSFSGGILSWILNVVERLFRDFIAAQAEIQVCAQLSGVLKDTENALAFAKDALDEYKPWEEDNPWDPLALENQLWLLSLPPDLKLLDFRDPDIKYAAMLESYVNQAVDFLSAPAVDPITGRGDMQANILIRSNLLEDGALMIESSDFASAASNIYEGHNDILKTSVRFDSVKLVGLDTLSTFNPLDNIGKYTHQNKLSWDYLAFEIKATIQMSPSTLSSSIIETPSNTVVTEQVEIFFGIDDLVAELSMISLFDQDLVESLTLSSFLKKDNAVPCFLSTIAHADFTSLFAEVGDILTPTLTGFVSTGFDRVISNGLDAASLMYEKIVLNAAPRYFQEVIRPLFADTLLKSQLEKDNICPSFVWTGDDSELVDFRDLLYLPLDAMLLGGTGQAPYGDLFSGLIMPYLRENVFEGSLFNDGYVRPLTKAQSGTEGQLSFTGDIIRHEDGKTELFDSMTLVISDAKLHNLDTVVGPMDLLMPQDANALANKVSLGGGARHLRASTQFSLDITGKKGPLNMQNVLDLSIAIPSSSLSLDVLARLKAGAMLNFPIVDITNYHCWLAAMDDSVAGSLGLLSLSLDAPAIKFDATCISCTSPGLQYIPEILQELETAGFNNMYNEKIISILVGLMTDYAKSVNFDEMMVTAPLHCPHNEKYDGSGDVPPFDFPEIPSLRTDSAETVLAIGVIAFQSATIIAAKNELLLAGTSNATEEEDLEVDLPPNSRILNLTTLDEDLGGWADVVLDELRLYLSSTSKDLLGLDLEVNNLLREQVLDEEGAFAIKFEDMQFEAMDYSISFIGAKLYGMDSIMGIDPLIIRGPQSVGNSIQFESLLCVCEVAVRSAEGNVEHIKLSYRFRDVTAQVDMNIALDMERVENIQLGSIFDLGRIGYCAASGVHDMKFSKLQLRIGTMDDPIVSGYFSDENTNNIRSIIDSMMELYKGDIVDAMPLFFDSSIRKSLNAKLPSLLQSVGDKCSPQTSNADDSFIDFRDLLLSPAMALALGGSGSSPYGDLFSTLYGMLQEKILKTGATNRPLINDFFRGLTERYSNTTGSMFFGGTVLEHTGRLLIAGLDATFGVKVSDVTIDNIDSVGDPLDVFRPILGEPNMVNNTVSFGVDNRPLGVSGDFYCSFLDGDGVDVRNNLRLAVSFEDVVMMASMLLKIVEFNFASFPLRDLTDPHCWLATVFSKSPSRSTRLRGLEMVDNAFSIGNFSLDINCTDCTSPNFDKLLLSLYDLGNATEAVDSIEDKTDNLLDADFLQVALDYLVDDAVTKCPHRPEYDPNAGNEEFLLTPEDSFGLLDSQGGVKKSTVFNVANSVIAGGIFMCGLLYRWFVERRNRKWISSLSREGHYHLQMQMQKEKEMDAMLDETTTSLFRSECISCRVRYGVPLILAMNLAMFLVAHLGVISVVNIDATLAGQPVSIQDFLSFTFIGSTQKTFENGGAEMVIMLWAFTGVWPYIKIMLSLTMWMVPPGRLGVNRRGRILLWIDALANLSIVDIFTLIVGVGLLLVFIGGPDKSYIGDDALYSLKAVVVPRAGCYCIVIAQRISRASSRFLLEYHEQAIQEATRIHESKLRKIAAAAHDDDNDSGTLHAPSPHSDSDEEEPSPLQHGQNRDDREAPSVPSSDEESVAEPTAASKKERKWGIIGAYFAAFTIVIVFVIGATFAPSISIDATSMGGLTIESDQSLDEVVGSYGVFLVVSGLLLKARFVFDERIDYIGFGLLLFAGVFSIAMVLVMKIYLFIQRKLKERREPPTKGPSYGHEGCGIPYYIRLTKWRHMEIYLIAVAIGIWQLGSVISYAIYFYCDLLTKTFEFMSFVGLVKNVPTECYNTQAVLPENLLIILGAFFALMIIFVMQARKQYKKNISDSLRWIDDNDVPRLSLAWSQDMSKNSKYAHLSSSLTASMSWDTNTTTDSDVPPSSSSSGRFTPTPGTPATEAWTPASMDHDDDSSYQSSIPQGTNDNGLLYRETSLGSEALQWSANHHGRPHQTMATAQGESSSTPERIGSIARRLRFNS
ncbi:unnamed protein product [Cylindrotheca closterium]|uniref:Calmodulin n=1 Tax=Cylindrotheca closterium TaxID=2856 RepID=A0AAD2CMD4_9STRA|nr:unnamed protein product [Cylindrotheca closterium]